MSITRRVVTNGQTFRIQFHVGDKKWRFYNGVYAAAEDARRMLTIMDSQDAEDAQQWTPVEKGGDPARSDAPHKT